MSENEILIGSTFPEVGKPVKSSITARESQKSGPVAILDHDFEGGVISFLGPASLGEIALQTVQ